MIKNTCFSDDCLSVKDPNEVVQGPALWHVMHRQKVETSSQTALAKDLAKVCYYIHRTEHNNI